MIETPQFVRQAIGQLQFALQRNANLPAREFLELLASLRLEALRLKAVTFREAQSSSSTNEWLSLDVHLKRFIEDLADMAASVEAQSVASQVPEHMPVDYPPGVADLMAVIEDLTEMASQVVEHQTSPEFVYKSLMGLCEDYKGAVRAHMGLPANIHG